MGEPLMVCKKHDFTSPYEQCPKCIIDEKNEEIRALKAENDKLKKRIRQKNKELREFKKKEEQRRKDYFEHGPYKRMDKADILAADKKATREMYGGE